MSQEPDPTVRLPPALRRAGRPATGVRRESRAAVGVTRLACRVWSIVDRILLYLAFAGLIAMMLLISADAASRYVFSGSIPFAAEIVTKLLMPLTAFFGMSHVVAERGLVRVEILVQRLPSRVNRFIEPVIELLGITATSIIAYQYLVEAVSTWGQRGVGFSVPPYLSAAVVGVGFFMAAVQILWRSIGATSRGVDSQKSGGDGIPVAAT